MRRLLPLLLLLAIGTAGASGVLNVLLGIGGNVNLYSGSVTAASNCPTTPSIGFSVSNSCGSISPSIDKQGHAPVALFTTGTNDTLEINGFSVDPSQSYFTTLTVNGNVYSASSASYSYNNGTGVAEWFYTGISSGFFLTAGTYTWSYH